MTRNREEIALWEATYEELIDEIKLRIENLCVALRDSDEKAVRLLQEVEKGRVAALGQEEGEQG